MFHLIWKVGTVVLFNVSPSFHYKSVPVNRDASLAGFHLNQVVN